MSRACLEATGGDECGVTEYLRRAGFEVPLSQPLQTKAFARLHLKRAENDASLMAAYTAALDAPTDAPNPRLTLCAGLLTFVEQIEEDVVCY